jgi:hypothetical protein
MATVDEVEAQIKDTLDVATRAFEADNSTGYEAFKMTVDALEAAAREAFQAKLADHLWPLVNKLEADEALTAAEQDMLKMMIVGEAQYYVKSEQDVDHWKDELQRLLQEIDRLKNAGLDNIDTLMHVRALCREGMRVLPDLVFYFKEQARVRQFEEATHNALDRDTRRTLANLIKEMIASDKI